MSAATTSFKLGLLTLLVLASIAIMALVLGARSKPAETIEYVTFFDESVVGLDEGAPVKLRGITVGTVDSVSIAPDGRLVRVGMKVDAAERDVLAWSPAHDDGLRVRVGSPGIAGVKLVDIDYLDPGRFPPPALSFPAPERYVPSARSFLGGVEESLADVSEALRETLGSVNRIVDELEDRELPAQLSAALGNMTTAADELRVVVERVNEDRIPARTATAIEKLDAEIDEIRRLTDRVGADGGLLENADRATASIDVLGRRAAGMTGDLDRTVRDLGDAARSVRSLTDALERSPDMLVKGRRPQGGSK